MRAFVTPIHEVNHCHMPDTGYFAPKGQGNCNGPGQAPTAPSGAGRSVTSISPSGKVLYHQPYGKLVPNPETLDASLRRIANDKNLSDDERTQALYDAIKAGNPAMVREVEGLVAKGKQHEGEFTAMVSTLAGRLGFPMHTNIESREVLEGNTNWVVTGPVKGVRRAAIKAATDYGGDVTQVKDVLRGTVAVSNGAHFAEALAKLSDVAEIVNIKDNVTRPLETGYRDLNVLVRLRGSGMLAEMQLITKPMLRTKMTIGHKLYEAWRDVPKTSARALDLMTQMQREYSTAWAASTMSAAGLLTLGSIISQLKR